MPAGTAEPIGIAPENRVMVSADALTKAGRLVEMQRMFATRPNRGLRTAEIAERLGIAPRTERRLAGPAHQCTDCTSIFARAEGRSESEPTVSRIAVRL